MKTLNTNEIQAVSGGGAVDGLFGAAVIVFGLGAVAAFALGASAVLAYQAYTSSRQQMNLR